MSNQHYITSDFHLSSFLLCQNIPLIGLERSPDRNKFVFVFENNSQLKDLIDAFCDGQALADPIKLFGASRELKKRISIMSLQF